MKKTIAIIILVFVIAKVFKIVENYKPDKGTIDTYDYLTSVNILDHVTNLFSLGNVLQEPNMFHLTVLDKAFKKANKDLYDLDPNNKLTPTHILLIKNLTINELSILLYVQYRRHLALNKIFPITTPFNYMYYKGNIDFSNKYSTIHTFNKNKNNLIKYSKEQMPVEKDLNRYEFDRVRALALDLKANLARKKPNLRIVDLHNDAIRSDEELKDSGYFYPFHEHSLFRNIDVKANENNDQSFYFKNY